MTQKMDKVLIMIHLVPKNILSNQYIKKYKGTLMKIIYFLSTNNM